MKDMNKAIKLKDVTKKRIKRHKAKGGDEKRIRNKVREV